MSTPTGDVSCAFFKDIGGCRSNPLNVPTSSGSNQNLHTILYQLAAGEIPGDFLPLRVQVLRYWLRSVARRDPMLKSPFFIVVCLTCLCSSQIAAPPKPN